MAGRANHRGWMVLESIGSSDGLHCVDFFQHPDGGFGFEHLRADPEDQGRWTAIGHTAGLRFGSSSEALDAAEDAVDWLTAESMAQQRVELWRSQLGRSG